MSIHYEPFNADDPGGEVNVFVNDVITPEQWSAHHKGTHTLSGERRLLIAVLDDAYHLLRTYREIGHGDEYEYTVQWVKEATIGCVTLTDACTSAGLNVAAVQRALLNLVPRNRRKPIAHRVWRDRASHIGMARL